MRTLVRGEYSDHERGNVGVIVSGWDPHEGVKLLLADLPKKARECKEFPARFFAKVNIGADSNEDLYFEEWEID